MDDVLGVNAFLGKAQAYDKGRPPYPDFIVDFLEQKKMLQWGYTVVADIGSGTGQSAKPLLEAGYLVLGVEFLEEMRQMAEAKFRKNPLFYSVAGAAEKTNLPDHSVDAITCVTALHRFRHEEARNEFGRILKPENPKIVIMRNSLGLIEGDSLEELHQIFRASAPEAYHRAMEGAASYTKELDSYIRESSRGDESFFVVRRFDEETFESFWQSQSFSLKPGEQGFDQMRGDLANWFKRYADGDFVKIRDKISVHFGDLNFDFQASKDRVSVPRQSLVNALNQAPYAVAPLSQDSIIK